MAETQAGKGSLPYDHPRVGRRDRRDRHDRRQRARPRGRPGDRHRHPLQRLHHRLADRLRSTRRAVRQHQRRRVRRRASTPAVPLVADARAALEALRAALDGWSVDPAYRGRARRRLAAAWDATVERRLPRWGTARCRPRAR